MRLLYIGYLMPTEQYYVNKALSFAAGRFERGLVTGLSNTGCDLTILSCEPHENYPKDKLFVKGQKNLKIENLLVNTVGYINYPILKHIILFVLLLFKCLHWFLQKPKEKNIIITYNLDTPILQVALLMQKFGVKYVPLISDLPFYNENDNGKLGFRKKLSAAAYHAQFNNIHKPWGSIILNENVKKDFNLRNTILIEGGISQCDVNEKCFCNKTYIKKDEKFTLFYCGSLDVFHGADKLMEIAKLLPPNEFQIIVCGRGNAEWSELFTKFSLINNVLIFKGEVEALELAELQQASDLLLIPHPTALKQLRYQFPSKLMDYALTRIPILSTPLPGIPKDYKKFIFFSKTDRVKDIYDALIEIKNLSLKQRSRIANNAADYILQEKNWDKNAQKICDFIAKDGH